MNLYEFLLNAKKTIPDYGLIEDVQEGNIQTDYSSCIKIIGKTPDTLSFRLEGGDDYIVHDYHNQDVIKKVLYEIIHTSVMTGRELEELDGYLTCRGDWFVSMAIENFGNELLHEVIGNVIEAFEKEGRRFHYKACIYKVYHETSETLK